MTALIWFAVIIAAIIIQATILPLFTVNGIRPDLLLIVVVSSSLLLGKEHGVGIGFFSGLIQDLASGNIFGINVLSKLATGYVSGLAERKVFKEHLLLPVLAIAIATIFSHAIIFLMLFLLGYKVDLGEAITGSVLPLAFYNMVLAIPVHKLIYHLSRKF